MATLSLACRPQSHSRPRTTNRRRICKFIRVKYMLRSNFMAQSEHAKRRKTEEASPHLLHLERKAYIVRTHHRKTILLLFLASLVCINLHLISLERSSPVRVSVHLQRVSIPSFDKKKSERENILSRSFQDSKSIQMKRKRAVH